MGRLQRIVAALVAACAACAAAIAPAPAQDRVALVMGKTGLTASAARALLEETHGNVRLAIEAAESGGRG